jgi:hypothetical protein
MLAEPGLGTGPAAIGLQRASVVVLRPSRPCTVPQPNASSLGARQHR